MAAWEQAREQRLQPMQFSMFHTGTLSATPRFSYFAVAMGMLTLIMVDAQSVRRAAGVQARLLNQMAEEFYKNHTFSPEKLVEFLGHTRLEVFMGALLGMVMALGIHLLFPVWSAQ